MRSLLSQVYLFIALLIPSGAARGVDLFVYFGTHSAGPQIGLSLSHFDSETGGLTPPKLLVEAKEPAFFVIHPEGRYLYTCNSGVPGGLSAYKIEPKTGELTLINRVLAGGGDTSFVSLDQTARYALVANYLGGNIAVFALRPDGGVGDWTGFAQQTGSSVDPERQTHAYAHAIITDPTNRFALVPDLGVDKLFVYHFDEKSGAIKPNKPPFAQVAAGLGPRHVRFHPNGRWVYLINEMGSRIIGFNWDSTTGALSDFQTISTLPPDFKGANACAELEVHPNGKFLYASNRGHDSLAVFAIDPSTGRLSLVEHTSSRGKTPRNFAFDPSARWILCTNHGSDNAVVFRVDPESGHLTPVGEPVRVPAPFCERFLPVSR